ncbi:hypothetical protein EON65_05185 [archaeon]|nr:MAG: hypothetical protein EON65_05185 [archaeon]
MIYASRESSIPLPMSSLGGSPNSLLNFRGCLLDARLWNHLKSEKQINAYMHRLLDMNKKKVVDGCIAWYTMEDGPGSLLSTDITRHRFKTPLTNALSYILAYTCSQAVSLPTICVSELPASLHPFIPKEVWEDIGLPEHFKKKTSKLRTVEKLRCQFAKTQWIKAESVRIYAKMPARMLKNMESGQRAMRLASNLPFYLLDSLAGNGSAAAGKDDGDNQSVNSEGAVGVPGATYSSVLPIPSNREMNICPFEIRKVKLAQSGRLLQRRFPCPLGCGEELRVFDKRYHVRHVCSRRLVRCRFDFCPCMYPAEEQDIHENSTNCEHMAERIKWLKHAAHSHKQIECTQCRETVPLKDLEDHMKKECEYRNIHCPYKDCVYGELLSKEASLPAHRLENHLKLECTSQKRKIL